MGMLVLFVLFLLSYYHSELSECYLSANILARCKVAFIGIFLEQEDCRGSVSSFRTWLSFLPGALWCCCHMLICTVSAVGTRATLLEFMAYFLLFLCVGIVRLLRWC